MQFFLLMIDRENTVHRDRFKLRIESKSTSLVAPKSGMIFSRFLPLLVDSSQCRGLGTMGMLAASFSEIIGFSGEKRDGKHVEASIDENRLLSLLKTRSQELTHVCLVNM